MEEVASTEGSVELNETPVDGENDGQGLGGVWMVDKARNE